MLTVACWIPRITINHRYHRYLEQETLHLFPKSCLLLLSLLLPLLLPLPLLLLLPSNNTAPHPSKMTLLMLMSRCPWRVMTDIADADVQMPMESNDRTGQEKTWTLSVMDVM
jgi:hypothetical protein